MLASGLLHVNEGHPVLPQIGAHLEVQKMPAHWLAQRPRTYTGIERDAQAVRMAERAIARTGIGHARALRGDAASVPLADGAASLVVGEAMLSMQTVPNKRAIMNEAFRLLRPGRRYLIHELAVALTRSIRRRSRGFKRISRA